MKIDKKIIKVLVSICAKVKKTGFCFVIQGQRPRLNDFFYFTCSYKMYKIRVALLLMCFETIYERTSRNKSEQSQSYDFLINAVI